jgi:hypothetical protein
VHFEAPIELKRPRVQLLFLYQEAINPRLSKFFAVLGIWRQRFDLILTQGLEYDPFNQL